MGDEESFGTYEEREKENEKEREKLDDFEELNSPEGDDVYCSAAREDLLDSDSISAEEEAFMDGYDSA